MKSSAHRLKWLWWMIIFTFLTVLPTPAASLLDRVKNQEISQIVRLKVGHSKVLRTPFALSRISVADPEIADIILISDKEVYVNGLAPGVTNISMWGKSRFTSATVTVEADITLLKEKLHQILPNEKIGVETAGDSIVLSGEVSGPLAQSTALSLARAFVGEGGKGATGGKGGGKSKTKVVNLMHVGGVQQVMLEVRVAEINRLVAQQIGIDFAAISPSGNFGVNQLSGLASLGALARTINPSFIPQQGTSGAPGTAFQNILSLTNIQAMAGWKAG
ncbi:MAG: pilus assembly protein N-terminal domain-containing protein, partial [Deltaproteobacteria bacterium]